MARMTYYADCDSSTVVCPCGASITWSGFESKLDEFEKEHAAHVTEEPEQIVTEDGKRAYS